MLIKGKVWNIPFKTCEGARGQCSIAPFTRSILAEETQSVAVYVATYRAVSN